MVIDIPIDMAFNVPMNIPIRYHISTVWYDHMSIIVLITILGELLQMASSLIPPKNALNSPDMWHAQT